VRGATRRDGGNFGGISKKVSLDYVVVSAVCSYYSVDASTIFFIEQCCCSFCRQQKRDLPMTEIWNDAGCERGE
jgi:hypothetical protein